MKDLTRCLLAMPRQALTQHNLSERTWSVLLLSLSDNLVVVVLISLSHTHALHKQVSSWKHIRPILEVSMYCQRNFDEIILREMMDWESVCVRRVTTATYVEDML